jgi:hypothetical protein
MTKTLTPFCKREIDFRYAEISLSVHLIPYIISLCGTSFSRYGWCAVRPLHIFLLFKRRTRIVFKTNNIVYTADHRMF